MIKNNRLFIQIFNNFDTAKYGISSVNSIPQPTDKYFGKIINYSVKIQEEIRRKWNNGVNYLAFKGCFLVLSNDFVQKVAHQYNLDGICNDDAYLYFFAKEQGYQPKYFPDLRVYYKSPTSFREHLYQSSRFQSSKEELSKLFTHNLEEEYIIPKKIIIFSAIRYFLKNPLFFSGYVLIYMLSKIKRDKNINSKWETVISTK